MLSFFRWLQGSPVAVGQFGIWAPNGFYQWAEPRRVVHVAWSHSQWWAWFDGSMTAVPAHQVEIRA
jgi:hypothetical protein